MKKRLQKDIGLALFALCMQIIVYFLITHFTGEARSIRSFVSDYVFIASWLFYLLLKTVIYIVWYLISKKGKAGAE